MTIPPSDDPRGTPARDEPEPRRRAIPIVTLASSAPERVHIATEEELADDRRLEGMRAHWARRPWATWSLIGVILVMFVIEEVLGGSERNDVLVRLGGQVPGEIALGAVWRLVSSAFLHAGVVHVGLNAYVIWIVGSSLERMLGSARFLLVYTGSLLVASAATLVLSDAQLTVGASGAGFGLFGVEAIVVFLRPDLLPAQIRQRHGRNVLTNLAINVAFSFMPGIATIAHFAGGLAGAAIGFFLVPQRFEMRPSTPRWAFVGAIACVLVLAWGVTMGLVHATRSSGQTYVVEVGRDPEVVAESRDVRPR